MIDLTMFQTTDDNGDVVDKQMPETKSFADVEQCINHHAGKNDRVVDLFVDMALLGEQWDWYAEYKEWLVQCDSVNEWNANRIEDEEGNLPDERPLPVMPVRPDHITCDEWKVANYQCLRKAAYGDVKTQLDMMHPETTRWEEEWLPFIEAVKGRYPK